MNTLWKIICELAMVFCVLNEFYAAAALFGFWAIEAKIDELKP